MWDDEMKFWSMTNDPVAKLKFPQKFQSHKMKNQSQKWFENKIFPNIMSVSYL